MKILRLSHIPLAEFGIALMVIFLPLSNNPDLMNSIQTAKSFNFLYFVMALPCVASIGLLFKKDGLKLNITIIDLLFFAFVAWVSLNKYLLHDVHAFSLRYFELLGLSVFYMIIRNVNQRYFTLILVSICLSGIVQAIHGNLQLWGYYPSHHGLFKMTGSFFNPGPYAGYLCCILPVALGLYWSHKNFKLEFSDLRCMIAKLFEMFDVSRLRGLMARPFEKIEREASNAKLQTRGFESKTSNLIEQLSFVAIKYLSLITLIAILLVLPAARSRAAWLGAIAGVAFLAWHKYRIGDLFRQQSYQSLKLHKRVLNIHNKTIVAVLALVLLVVSFTLYSYKKDSADGRLLIWTVTANIIKDYPLLGVGQDLFKAHYMDYQADYFRNHPNSKYEQVANDNQYAFNEPLNIWIENGLIGLLLAGGIVFVIFITPSFNRKEHIEVINHEDHKEHEGKYEVDESLLTIANLQHGTITKASILAVIIFGMFAYPSEILPTKIITTVCLALLAGMTVPLFKRENVIFVSLVKKPLHPLWLRSSLAVATVVAVVLLLPSMKNLHEVYTTWKDAFDRYNYGIYTECLDDYKKAYPQLHHNGEFMINYGKALSIAENHNYAIETLEKAKSYQTNTVLYTALGDTQKAMKQYANAEKSYCQASVMTPCNFYPQYLLAMFYDETGQQQKAIDIATALLKKEVKVESTAIKEIHEEMEKIIERNTVWRFSYFKNTNNGQKSRNATHLNKR